MTLTASHFRLIGIIGAILLIGFVTGYASDPKASYGAFIKPSFAPPPWLFGPVWTVLYIMIGIVGWRLYEAGPGSALFRLWLVQMGLNLIWTPIFFMANSRSMALVVILALLATILMLIGRLWSSDRTSALLLLPYALWVSFATVLNAAIVRLN